MSGELKEELVIWFHPVESQYYLDCAFDFAHRKKQSPEIELTTRLNIPCQDADEIAKVLNLKNVCILPKAYKKGDL